MTTFGLGAMADNSEKVKEQRRPDGAGPKSAQNCNILGKELKWAMPILTQKYFKNIFDVLEV